MRNQFLKTKDFLIIPICCLVICLACNKEKFLDDPPSSDLFIPKSLADFRALLDNDEVMRETPMMGEMSADNFFISNTLYTVLKTREKYCYTWNDPVYFPNEINVDDWDKPYQQVFYANIVFDGLRNIQSTKGGNPTEFDAIKGMAHFIRAYAFYNVAQVFSPPYDTNISQEENAFGIPLRLTPIIQEQNRSTVIKTYDQVLADLDTATLLLPGAVDMTHLNRPSKAAAYALLARVQLSMREYEAALISADRCLAVYNSLIDYNTIDPAVTTPFPKDNAETLYQSMLLSTAITPKAGVGSPLFVDSSLYLLYSPDDLRLSLFYTNTLPFPNPKRGYTGLIFLFSGMATDEVYLIKSECLARAGNYTEAMDVLNQLLVKRYRTGSFVPLVAANAQQALDTILVERRKELPFRGVRWSDLRRLNKEGENIVLSRVVNGQSFELLPNSKKYVFPLPESVRKLGQLEQYERN